jgi:hypothetical protein
MASRPPEFTLKTGGRIQALFMSAEQVKGRQVFLETLALLAGAASFA